MLRGLVTAVRRVLGQAAETLTFLGLGAALAAITHHAAGPLRLPAAEVLQLWIPVGYLVQSTLVPAVARRVSAGIRSLTLAADLLAWGPPLVLVLGARLGEVSDLTPWLAAALFLKAGSLLFAVAVAVRAGTGDGQAGRALAAAALGLYLLAIPITRLHVLDGRSAGLAGDEPMYLVPAVSLLRDHDLFVEDEYARLVYWSFYPAELGVGHSVWARDGHVASYHDAGLSLLAALPYAVGGWQLVVAAMTLAAAALVGQVYRAARAAGAAAQAALAAAALTGLTLPVAGYSAMVFPEVPVALAVAVALRHLWAAQRGLPASPAAAGLALGVMPWLHVRSWPLVALLAATGALVWRGRSDRVRAAFPLLAGVSGYLALNVWVYGRWQLSPAVGGSLLDGIRSVPVSAVTIAWARPWLDGFNGLLLLAPVFVLALAALPRLARSGPAGAGSVIALGIYGGLIGVWDLVSGEGWGPPGRFMVPVTPFLAVGLALALQPVLRRPVARLLTGLLIAWSLACSFYAFADRIGVYTLDRTAGAVGTLSSLAGIPLPAAMPSFDRPGPRSFLVVAAAVAVVLGLHRLLLAGEPAPTGASREARSNRRWAATPAVDWVGARRRARGPNGP